MNPRDDSARGLDAATERHAFSSDHGSAPSAGDRRPLRLLSADADARLTVRRSVLLALMLSAAANVLLAGALLIRTPPTQTIIVPPEAGFSDELGTSIRSAYKFDQNGPDAKFIERTALTLLQLVATNSPETGRAQLERFLTHVDPEAVTVMRTRLTAELESLAEDRAASVFYPEHAVTSKAELTVTVDGRHRFIIGTKPVADAKKRFRLHFRHDAGRLWLTALEELPAK